MEEYGHSTSLHQPDFRMYGEEYGNQKIPEKISKIDSPKPEEKIPNPFIMFDEEG